MFKPNKNCRLKLSSNKTNKFGQPLPSILVAEKCAVVKLSIQSEKTSVRADSSASRGSADEYQADAVILLSPKSRAMIDDIILIEGVSLRIVKTIPRFDVQGIKDHTEVHANFWSNKV